MIPPLTTLYDSVTKAECYAAGGTDLSCKYYCDGKDTGADPSTGACDEASGACERRCGIPDQPMTRYSSLESEIDYRYGQLMNEPIFFAHTSA